MLCFYISELCPACRFWVRWLVACLAFFWGFRAVRATFQQTVLAERGPEGLWAHLDAIARPALWLPPPPKPLCCFFTSTSYAMLAFFGCAACWHFWRFFGVFGSFRTTFRETVLATRGLKGLRAHLGVVARPASGLPPPPKPFCCLFTSASYALLAFLGCATCWLPHLRPPPFLPCFLPLFCV